MNTQMDSTKSVLRCTLCDKPFDRQSSLKRHGYYCRSRKVGVISRSRSCIACAKSKIRCDGARPACGRCANKNHECHYNTGNIKPSKTPNTSNVVQAGGNGASAVAPASQSQPATSADTVYTGTELDVLNMNYLDWSMIDDALFGMPSWDMTMPTMPATEVRTLTQRHTQDTGMQRVASLMLSTFKSYLRDMLHHDTMPPFIHPSQSSSANISEPLANCISLIHMISSPKGSRKLFWRNVRTECEHIRAGRYAVDEKTLLAAMQALSIYIFVRLDEGETEHNNLDSLLVDTITAAIEQFSAIDACRIQRATQHADGRPSWENWILEESRRRLSLVMRIINMLVYFQPVNLCTLPKDLLLAPLPARKRLWEAPEAHTWKLESEGHDETYGMAKSGELVRLNESSLLFDHTDLIREKFCGAESYSKKIRNVAAWEDWLSNTDGFGGLVMLAASLAE